MHCRIAQQHFESSHTHCSSGPTLAARKDARFRPCEKPKLVALAPDSRPTLPKGPLFDPAWSVLIEDSTLVWENPGRPPIAQAISNPHLILQSQTRAKTGVLMRTLRTGNMSGYRAGGERTSSIPCKRKQAVYTAWSQVSFLPEWAVGTHKRDVLDDRSLCQTKWVIPDQTIPQKQCRDIRYCHAIPLKQGPHAAVCMSLVRISVL